MVLAGPLPVARAGPGSGWILAVGIVVLSGAVLASLDRAGRSARVEGPARPLSDPEVEVVLARTSAEAVATWRARGLKGRTLLHAGRFLHFVSDEERPLAAALLTAPGRGRALDEALVRAAGPRNHLWVTASLGIARRILYLPPPRSLARRLEGLGATPDSLPLDIPIETTPRTLLGALPRLDEPVLVEIHASWFDEGSASDLKSALRAVRADLVVASLAEDADDVSPEAREALRDFVRELAEPAQESSP